MKKRKRRTGAQIERRLASLAQARRERGALAPAQLREAQKLLATMQARGTSGQSITNHRQSLGLAALGPARIDGVVGLRAQPPLTASFLEELTSFNPMAVPLESWFAAVHQASDERLSNPVDDMIQCLRLCDIAARHAAGAKPSPAAFLIGKHLAGMLKLSEEMKNHGPRGAAFARRTIAGVKLSLMAVLETAGAHAVVLRVTPPKTILQSHKLEAAAATARRAELVAGLGAQPSARFIEHNELVYVWDSLALRPAELWVDLGSGDGESLRNMALRNPSGRFLGVEVASSTQAARAAELTTAATMLPCNVTYLMLGSHARASEHVVVRALSDADLRLPDRIADATVAAVGRDAATIVTLLYPLHNQQRDGTGRVRLAVEHQLESAVAMLRPGGMGVLVTEDIVALQRCAALLVEDSRVSSVCVVKEAVRAEQLLEMGITPFRPSWRDIVHAPVPSTHDGLRPFWWGLVLFFWRAREADTPTGKERSS